MLKKLLKNPYIISGVIVFLLLFFLGIFSIGFSLPDSLLVSAVISICGGRRLLVEGEDLAVELDNSSYSAS